MIKFIEDLANNVCNHYKNEFFVSSSYIMSKNANISKIKENLLDEEKKSDDVEKEINLDNE